ncbi:MAG TPA: arginine--tRNA ligase [Alphaproteobacteria bacterium]|nr:arginine--tRNA ligase [Alphaproteobacteria bacterium]
MLLDDLTRAFKAAFQAAGFDSGPVEVAPSNRPDLCQFQCNAALALAKAVGRAPREVANSVLPHLARVPGLIGLEIAGPGFINFSLADDELARRLEAMRADARLGCPELAPDARGTVVIDYGGPNVAKAMHVGHLRAGILGDSLHRLATFLGARAIGDVHLGDWGLPMGILIAELARRRPELPYFDAGTSGPYPKNSPVTIEELNALYPEAAQRADADPAAREAARVATFELQQGRPGYRALWQHFVDVSVAEAKADFASLGVAFDLWYGESRVNDRIPALVARLKEAGVALPSEGAVIVPVARASDRKPMPPLMLENSEGGATYGTTDLATIEDRIEALDPDLILYVVDQRQHLHFEQVFRAAEAGGLIKGGRPACEHVGFGTVNGIDGKPLKTRAGGVMRLAELVEQAIQAARRRLDEIELSEEIGAGERERIAELVGLATIRYADLSNHRLTDYIFNIDKFSRFEGRTGPYLCYAAVRANSILEKAAAAGSKEAPIQAPSTAAARDVALALLDFGRRVHEAYAKRAPNTVAEHAYELAQKFNAFYHQHHILSEDAPDRRGALLALARLVRDQMRLALGLLGIATPERM